MSCEKKEQDSLESCSEKGSGQANACTALCPFGGRFAPRWTRWNEFDMFWFPRNAKDKDRLLKKECPAKKRPLRRFLTKLLGVLSCFFGEMVAFQILSHCQPRPSENTKTVSRCSFLANKVFWTCFSENRSDWSDGFPKLSQAKTE